jgi:transposase InsO family protein
MHLVNKPEPLLPSSFPERPWQTLAADFFKCENVDYLLVVDYFSRYVEVCAMQKNKTAMEVCRVMKSIFSRYGIPEKVKSDNGPPFNSGEYLQFANEWGFEVAHSSPKYPKSNGEVERAVQTVKRLLKKEKDKEKALLAYRSTPLSCGYSPAELLMGRKIRTTVPVFHTLLTPKWPNLVQLQEQEVQRKIQQEKYFNTRHRAVPLQKLTQGTEVRITTHSEPGVIKNDTESPRQYEVETPTGVIKRNRVHLVPLPPETSNEHTLKDSKTPELNIYSRPKRTLKLSLKARENKGLA